MTQKLEIVKKESPSRDIFNMQIYHGIPVPEFTHLQWRDLEPPVTNWYGVDSLDGVAWGYWYRC